MIPICPNCGAVLYEANENLYECEICLRDFMKWEILERHEDIGGEFVGTKQVDTIKHIWSEEVVWKYREGSSYQLIKREYSLYDPEDEIPEYLEDTAPILEIVYQGASIWGTYTKTFATFNDMPMRSVLVDTIIKTLSEYLERPNICLSCLGRMDWISGWGDYSCSCSR